MLHVLRRHPLPVAAHFEHSLVLAYAFPHEELAPLLPPGLTLDTHGDRGLAAVAIVHTRSLRPRGVPDALGLEPETGRILAVRGVRSGWDPEPVAIESARVDEPPFSGGALANAFHVANVDYCWERGRVLPKLGGGALGAVGG